MGAHMNIQAAQIDLTPNVMVAACPSRAILGHLTSRWGALVIVTLQGDTMRFSALRRHIGGVSERMLAQTLQQLEADGFVLRTAHEVVPPHVDYSLTPLGREAAAHVAALINWIEGALPKILAVRRVKTKNQSI